MLIIYYYVMLAISLVLTIVYAYIFHKHFDVNLTIMTVLVPFLNLAFAIMASATNINEALAVLKFTYVGGFFLLPSAMFLIFNICGINVKPWIKASVFGVSTILFCSTLTIGHNDLFYNFSTEKGMPTLEYFNGAAYINNKTYGPFHTVFYVVMILYYAATITAIIYSFIKKKQVSRRILIWITLAVSTAIFGFFGSRFFTNKIEILPASYNLGMIFYMIIASRLRLYDPSDSVTDSLVQKGDTGFISFDHKMRYLGSNDTAKEMFPELNDLVIDHQIKENEWANNLFTSITEEFRVDESNNKKHVERDNKDYLISVNHLYIGKLYHGYQFFITDDTVNQQHIKLIQNYNSQLEEEVAKKTAHVIEMQNKLVLGMATMIEGRDNSTGGHIKRTSDCIRFLVDEMRKDNYPELTNSFYQNVIRAAPMHDLGKITIDDAILRKPGKFTPEEFEVMKTHAAEGAKIVHRILEGTDDIEFHLIAENMAHYHHERWDGSGYPDGLKGEEIPIEARIMAIADVYDALVSKRVYKESMSFEEADKIIMEGMGKHFDKSLEIYYVRARSNLEKYYKNS